MGDTFETFERGCGAPLARRNRIQAAIAALLLAGCCSYDPAALGSADVDDRREALACLGVLAEEDATIRAEARAAALNHLDPEVERNPAVRSTAVRVLEQVEAGQDAPAADVVDALSGRVTATGEHLRIRADALSALGRLATADPKVEVLLREELAGDRSAEIRLTAAVALGRRAKLRAASTDALIAALTDPSRDVRFNALRALRTIHHVDRGLDRARWQEWRDEEMPFDEPEPAAEEAAPEGPTVPSEPFPEEDFDFEPEQQ